MQKIRPVDTYAKEKRYTYYAALFADKASDTEGERCKGDHGQRTERFRIILQSGEGYLLSGRDR